VILLDCVAGLWSVNTPFFQKFDKPFDGWGACHIASVSPRHLKSIDISSIWEKRREAMFTPCFLTAVDIPLALIQFDEIHKARIAYSKMRNPRRFSCLARY